jgi:hypothetical protein
LHNRAKYAVRQRIQPTIAPLTAAVSLALGATAAQAATITVDTLSAGSVAGQCTLQDAFLAADTDSSVAGCIAGSGPDVIDFEAGLSGTIAVDGVQLGTGTEISVTGPGASQITISGSSTRRLFVAMTNNAALSISGLTLADAYASDTYGGAAVLAAGGASLSLSDCVITGNRSSGSFGGAVSAVGADLSVDNCDFSDNSSEGGITRGSASAQIGGAIFSLGSSVVTIADSSFTNNTAATAGGAIGISYGGAVDLEGLSLFYNAATFGGGIALTDNSQASLTYSTISYNQAYAGGGIMAGSGASLDAAFLNVTENLAYADGGGVLAGAGVAGPVVNTSKDENETLGTSPSVYGPGTVELYASLIGGNQANRYGGGLASKYTDSYLVVVGSEIVGNQAGAPTSGPVSAGEHHELFSRISGSSNYGGGGGVAALSDSVAYIVEDSILHYNQAVQGGAVLAYGGTAALVYSDAVDNYATYGGGLQVGLYGSTTNGANPYDSLLVAGGSHLAGNQALVGGGALSIEGGQLVLSESTVADNLANTGGGVAAYQAGVAVKYSELSANSAEGYGGGLWARASGCYAQISDSTISDNSASTAGGAHVMYCEATIERTTIAGNSAEAVGGLVIDGVPGGALPAVRNSTITNNTAAEVGGLRSNGLLTDFLTVSHNTATGLTPKASGEGRGIPQSGGASLTTAAGDVEIRNSIFSDNVGPSGPLDLEIFIGTGTSSMGYTLVESSGTGVPSGTGNIIGVDPQLAALTDNGGWTATRALAAGSPALDAADPATTVEFDQRGEPYRRVFGGRADMGAFEFVVDAMFSDRFEQP